MKTNKLSTFIAVGVLFAGVSTATLADDKWLGESGANWQEHVQSTKSRAQVIEELRQARAQGLVTVGEDPFYPRQPTNTSTRSRAEVRAEAAQAANNANNDFNELYVGGGA